MTTNSELVDQIPPLKPPHGEIPPGFWEQHGGWIVVGGLLLICLVAWSIRLLTKKRRAREVAPETEARHALANLRTKPQSGEVLSEASQVTKNYFVRAFNLPPGEHTTSEMCALAQASSAVGNELSKKLGAFLTDLDRRKFAETKESGVSQCLDEASALIETSENRRQELRQVEASKAQHARQS